MGTVGGMWQRRPCGAKMPCTYAFLCEIGQERASKPSCYRLLHKQGTQVHGYAGTQVRRYMDTWPWPLPHLTRPAPVGERAVQVQQQRKQLPSLAMRAEHAEHAQGAAKPKAAGTRPGAAADVHCDGSTASRSGFFRARQGHGTVYMVLGRGDGISLNACMTMFRAARETGPWPVCFY